VAEKPHSVDAENLRASAARVVESGVLGSGRVLPRLFAYLVARALTGEVPKEFDIAVDVFGKDTGYRDGGDAQIRVWIYRLRSRLERYYAGRGQNDPFRIAIPKGTYKLEAKEHRAGTTSVPDRAVRLPGPADRALALVFVLAIVVSATVYYAIRSSDASLVSNSVWSGVADSKLPIIIVVGDHFFFGEPDSPIRIRDIRINSHEELRHSAEYRSNPDLVFDTLSYLPKSAAFSLPTILPRVSATKRNFTLKLASELTPEDLRVADIVFIGFIRSMGVLGEYYSKISSFDVQPPYLQVVRTETGESFTRSGPLPQSNTDYGLFARFEGPTGNQIVLFSGIGDPGVLATARALNGAEGIRQIEQMVASNAIDASGNWEALIEVDGHSRTDLDYRLVGLFPMKRRDHGHDDPLHAARSVTGAER
jgi:hypothetical protein